jgi:hypothetical protein
MRAKDGPMTNTYDTFAVQWGLMAIWAGGALAICTPGNSTNVVRAFGAAGPKDQARLSSSLQTPHESL